MFGIIYKATNLKNNKVYIGQTTESLGSRKSKHYNKAFNNKFNTYFLNALKKYDKNDFTWEEIDNANTLEELNTKEQHWIKYYNSNIHDYGYNSTSGGDYSIMTEETRKKISIAKKQYKFTDKHKKNISLKTKEGMASQEVKQKLSQIKKEFYANMSPEQKKEFFKKHKGRNAGKKKPPRTKEHCKHLGESVSQNNLIKRQKEYEILESLDRNKLKNIGYNNPMKSWTKIVNNTFNINIRNSIIQEKFKEWNIIYAKHK